jgi:hypothetical protein
MGYIDLENWFRLNFSLQIHHSINIPTVEFMMPWEREVYATMISQYVEEENLKRKAEQDGYN